ncbi:MAG: hypothetical protein WDO69_18865 [Pseudomonadota bacterium]
MDKDERIADIALFFYKGVEEKACWISEKLYTDPKYLVGATPNPWRDAVVNKLTVGEPQQQPAYVTNLANLDPPGSPPTPEEDEAMKAEGAKKQQQVTGRTEETKPAGPSSGDIFIVPFSEPDNVYRIPQAVYENPDLCPELKKNNSSDLYFMAKTEGVVLANVPKVDLAGLSCYLLNLRALRNSRAARR